MPHREGHRSERIGCFARRCATRQHNDTTETVGTSAVAGATRIVTIGTPALGAVAARIGGAPMLVGAARVTIRGMLAMLATAAVGRLFGTTVA